MGATGRFGGDLGGRGGTQLISAPPAEEICGINAAWTAAGCVFCGAVMFEE